MKVVLISPYADIQSFGVRLLAACLRKAGHDVRILFLWRPTVAGPAGAAANLDEYPEPIVREMVRLCSDAQLIGVSLMTEHVFRARSVTRKLKESLKIPVIWGGVHPTIQPEECLQYADFVCVGEGEHAFPAFVNTLAQDGDVPVRIPGIWRMRDGRLEANGASPLTHDLDSLPTPDYETDGSYVADGGELKPLTDDLMRKYLALEPYDLPGGVTFGIVSSRGCPFNCSFCSTNYFRHMYKKEYRVRLRSVDHLMDELRRAKERFPYITGVRFHDDTFVAREVKDLEYFRERYRREIGLPFACYAHPSEVTEEKLRVLCDAGMAKLGIGIQTGSARLQELYHRRVPNDRILAAARLIRRFHPPMQPPWYDMIIDYYNEQESDALESFKLLQELPRPHSLHVFSMVLWPGTALYEKAKAEGRISADMNAVYRSSYNVPAVDFRTLVYKFYEHSDVVPMALTRLLSRPRVFHALNHRALRPLYPLLFAAGKRLKALVGGR